MRPLRLGTRASALAMTQSGLVADALRALGMPVELETVRTLGDERPPDTTWGEGAFVGALETALLSGEVDLAVHSAKDVPTTEDPRLVIAAYPRRRGSARRAGRPRTRAHARHSAARQPCRHGQPASHRLPAGAPARPSDPSAARQRRYAAAPARQRRDGRARSSPSPASTGSTSRAGSARSLAPDLIPPAPGQGSLAVQCRADDDTTRAWLARLDDPNTRAAVETERAFLHASGGGCRAPLGALARVEGDEIVLVAGSAGIEAADASAERRPAPRHRVGHRPWADRRPGGARGRARREAQRRARRAPSSDTADGGAPRVLVTRAAEQAAPLVEALQAAGLEVEAVPTIAIEPVSPGGPLDDAAAQLARYAWVVVTSANGARAVVEASDRCGTDVAIVRWAAVGSATAAALAQRGITATFTPALSSGDGIADELPVSAGDRVLLARADIADDRLPARLRERGADVDEVVAYRTVEAPPASREQLARAFALGPLDAIVFTSGSTVRGLLSLLTPQERRVALRSAAWCIGPSTAAVARESGFGRVTEAPGASAPALAASISSALLSAGPDDRRPSRRSSHRRNPRRPDDHPCRTGDHHARSGHRLRRLRRTAGAARPRARDAAHPRQLVAPLFVQPGRGGTDADLVAAGLSRLSPDEAVIEARGAGRASASAGSSCSACRPRRTRSERAPGSTTGSSRRRSGRIRDADLDLVVIADTCLCEYTDHGHCGPLDAGRPGRQRRRHRLLAETAASQARAGADVVAPSAMMDGQVAAIRAGARRRRPRRDPDPGLRRQDRLGLLRAVPRGRRLGARVRRPARLPDGPGERREAMREMAVDVAEGADMLLVKPAMPSLDILAARPRALRRPDRRLPGQRRVRPDRGGRRARLDRRPPDPAGGAHLDRPGRRARSSSRTPRPTSRPGSGRRTDDRPTAQASGRDAPRPAPDGRPPGPRRGPLPGRRQQPGPGLPLRRAAPPLVLDAGAGPRVRDADGRWYLDYIGAWGPAILGHAHPAVVEAVRDGRPRRVRPRRDLARARSSSARRSGRPCRRWSGCASPRRAPRPR